VLGVGCFDIRCLLLNRVPNRVHLSKIDITEALALRVQLIRAAPGAQDRVPSLAGNVFRQALSSLGFAA